MCIDSNTKVAVSSEASVADISDPMRWTHAVIDAAHSSQMELKKLYTLFGVLSSAIHGHSWSGPGILVLSKLLSPTYAQFIKSLAVVVGLTVTEDEVLSDADAVKDEILL